MLTLQIQGRGLQLTLPQLAYVSRTVRGTGLTNSIACIKKLESIAPTNGQILDSGECALYKTVIHSMLINLVSIGSVITQTKTYTTH